MNKLQAVSISYKIIGSKKLNQFYLDEGQLQEMEVKIKTLKPKGYFFLSTCNRQELYIDHFQDVRNKVISFWLEIKKDKELKDICFRTYYGNGNTFKYLAKVAMGLHSAIKGDDQIYSQIKKSVNTSRKNNNLSTRLERMYQQIARVNKRSINETEYKSKSVSLAYQSLKLATQLITEISKPSLLIIGAGELAQQVVKNISKFDFYQVTVANRTISNAQSLQKYYPQLRVIGLDKIDLEMNKHHVVISCTGARESFIQAANSSYQKEIKIYIDLTRQNQHKYTTDKNLKIIDLEDMFQLLNKNEGIRNNSIRSVQKIIREEVLKYKTWISEFEERQMAITG